jgi:pyruvate,water dikinase
MSTVLGLHELGCDDIARAGGKGANLGELIKAGFDVPDGFVLTTEATHWVMRYRGPAKRVRRWVATARIGVAFREDTHAEAGWALPIFRRALLEAGRRLGTAGVLDTPEDVYHLRLEELEAIADASRLDPSERDRLRDLMRRRAARREELAGVPLIDPNLVFPPLPDDNALVTGTPAGGGRVSGAVRVVREPSEFGTLRQGEILVCPAIPTRPGPRCSSGRPPWWSTQAGWPHTLQSLPASMESRRSWEPDEGRASSATASR